MRAPLPPPAVDLAPLFEHEREIPPVPPVVRARVLARARAAQVAGVKPAPLASAPALRGRWAVAAALLCLVSTAATAAVIEFRGRLTKVADRTSVSSTAELAPRPIPRRASRVARAPVLPTPVTPPPVSSTKGPEPRHLSAAEAVRDELRLLKQARAAVSHGEYAAAFRFVTEHARRFKGGRLTEEREALRVLSLAGLGRTDDAERAAATFRVRFPRSVLLEAVSQAPAAKP
jgi:hypothetical protein